MIVVNIPEALNLFNISENELFKIDKKQLNKIYRQLMKRYHPDLITTHLENWQLGATAQSTEDKAANLKEAKKVYEEASKLINEANSILEEALTHIENEKKLKQQSTQPQIVSIISFQNLLDLQDGTPITLVGKNGEQHKITSINTKSLTLSVKILIALNFKGKQLEYETVQSVNRWNEYEIDCNLRVESPEDLRDNESLAARIVGYGKDVGVKLISNPLKMRLNFDNKVKLNVNIYRKLVTAES